MKKILAIVSMAAMVAGAAFAVDFTSRVYLKGEVANGDADGISFFKMNKTDQKDSDALIYSVNGEQAGASFQFWYNAPDGAVQSRGTKIWIKPIDQIKVTFGAVGSGLYVETLDWWKVGSPFAVNARDYSAHPKYANNADVDGYGAQLMATPITGLTLTAAVAAGGDTNTISYAYGPSFDWDDLSYNALGATAKYQINDMISVAAGYRDNGKTSWKIARAGADVKVAGFYGFVQGICGFDYTSADKPYDLTGVCIDDFFKYSAGAFTVMARFPVTIRLTDEDTDADPSYMEYRVKASYTIGAFTPYLSVESNPDDDIKYAAIVFTKDLITKSLNAVVQPGVAFNVGSCAFDFSFKASIHSQFAQDYGSSDAFTWSIPFTASVSL